MELLDAHYTPKKKKGEGKAATKNTFMSCDSTLWPLNRCTLPTHLVATEVGR
jgi:hypothetical protein